MGCCVVIYFVVDIVRVVKGVCDGGIDVVCVEIE